METCPRCRHSWKPVLILQEYAWSRKFVKQWLQCDICNFIRKRTVMIGDHNQDYPVEEPFKMETA